MGVRLILLAIIGIFIMGYGVIVGFGSGSPWYALIGLIIFIIISFLVLRGIKK